MPNNIPTTFKAYGNVLDTEKTLEAVSTFYLHFGTDTVPEASFALNSLYAYYAEQGEVIPKDIDNLLCAVSWFLRELHEARLPLKASTSKAA